MPKKKNYSVHWENEQAVSFEVDGVTYPSLGEVPEIRDRQKLREMMAEASEPDFNEKEWEQIRKEANKGLDIVLWVFGGISVLMLLIAAISAFSAVRKISSEDSVPGVVVDVVARREYVNEQDRIVQEYYYPVVRFVADDGRRRDVQMTEGSSAPEYEAGDEVTVRYNPDHPLDARIDSFGSTLLMWILPSITGILGLAFGGAVFA
ncbi:MAG TPA: DUF3592 domain-containing protein, partial [Pseudomonadales bacterium]|nr:DUF3592 domain-containing protein [Pseudomonadales bacterium]